MTKHLQCYFNASLARVVAVETRARLPRVWVVRQPGVVSVASSLSPPRQRFSHISQDVLRDWYQRRSEVCEPAVCSLLDWNVSRRTGPTGRSSGPVVRRASFFVRLLLETLGGLSAAETERRREALTGCAANVSSLLSNTAETFYFTSL